MAIKIEKEPENLGAPYELCIFCRNPTPYWSIEKDVPVCPHCAEKYPEEKVITKEEWFIIEKGYEDFYNKN